MVRDLLDDLVDAAGRPSGAVTALGVALALVGGLLWLGGVAVGGITVLGTGLLVLLVALTLWL